MARRTSAMSSGGRDMATTVVAAAESSQAREAA
jgi:hypothetical protein